jgi:hypothetical protein
MRPNQSVELAATRCAFDIDEHHLKPHPEPTKAHYICEAQYR